MLEKPNFEMTSHVYNKKIYIFSNSKLHFENLFITFSCSGKSTVFAANTQEEWNRILY